MTRGMVPPNGGTFDLCERHILSYPLWNKICIYMIQERKFLFFIFFNQKIKSVVVRWISFKIKILTITNILLERLKELTTIIFSQKKIISLSFLLIIFRVDSAIFFKKKIQINKIADCMKYVTP